MKDKIGPWTSKDVDAERLLRQFHGERDGYIQVGTKNYMFPKRFAEEGENFYNFQPRHDDTWVVTFPRSGTTLTQELVWILSNHFDYKTAARIPLGERFPFLEFSACVNKHFLSDLLLEAKDDWTRQSLLAATDSVIPALEKTRNPRFIKTHIPLSLLNPQLLSCGAKVIYVARNPKDVAVSYYHLHQLFKTLDFNGTFEEFWNYFESDQLMWCPYWSHINEAWEVRHNPNLLFIFYEEIQQNIRKSIHRIGSFLGVDVTHEEAEGLAQHLDIANFRNNPSVNSEDLRALGLLNDTTHKFIRRGGKMSTSEPEFTPELARRADIWTRKHLEKTTLRFPEKSI